MAAPITHIVFAKNVCDTLPNMPVDQFVIGTSFPDIRYLGSISRETTHKYEPTTLNSLDPTKPFMAGMMFHTHLDNTRNTYWKTHGIYERLSPSKYLPQTLKFYEDIVLYERVADWREIGNYFDTITQEEISFNLPKHDIEQWHRLLKRYITAQPTIDTISQFITSIDPSGEATAAISTLLTEFSQREDIRAAIDAFYEDMPRDILLHAG